MSKNVVTEEFYANDELVGITKTFVPESGDEAKSMCEIAREAAQDLLGAMRQTDDADEKVALAGEIADLTRSIYS